jgi:hypothetical protein
MVSRCQSSQLLGIRDIRLEWNSLDMIGWPCLEDWNGPCYVYPMNSNQHQSDNLLIIAHLMVPISVKGWLATQDSRTQRANVQGTSRQGRAYPSEGSEGRIECRVAKHQESHLRRPKPCRGHQETPMPPFRLFRSARAPLPAHGRRNPTNSACRYNPPGLGCLPISH